MSIDNEPAPGSAPVDGSDVVCPFCLTAVDGEVSRCPRCAASHHRSCFNELGGCAVLGCSAPVGQGSTGQSVVQSPPPSWTPPPPPVQPPAYGAVAPPPTGTPVVAPTPPAARSRGKAGAITAAVAITLLAAGGAAAAVVVPMLDDARSEAEAAGFEDGYDEGSSDGYDDGKSDGYSEGLDDGTPTSTSGSGYPASWYPVDVDTFLLVRSGPGTAFPEVGKVAADDSVMVECATYGEAIEDNFGVADDTWYQIRSPFPGYVSGMFVDAGFDRVPTC